MNGKFELLPRGARGYSLQLIRPLDAVVTCQQRNELKPDRDLGGVDSERLHNLVLPVSQFQS